jgi:hypothetical protein
MSFDSPSTPKQVVGATLIVAAVAIICNVVLLLTFGVGIIPYRTARPATSLILAVQGNDIPAVLRPLRVSYETRATVDKSLAPLGDDRSQRLRAATLALAKVLCET